MERLVSFTKTVLVKYSTSVTCRGFGFLEQHTILFNSKFYYDSLSPGEYLLRCGIDTSKYMNITIQHTEQLVHVENTS